MPVIVAGLGIESLQDIDFFFVVDCRCGWEAVGGERVPDIGGYCVELGGRVLQNSLHRWLDRHAFPHARCCDEARPIVTYSAGRSYQTRPSLIVIRLISRSLAVTVLPSLSVRSTLPLRRSTRAMSAFAPGRSV